MFHLNQASFSQTNFPGQAIHQILRPNPVLSTGVQRTNLSPGDGSSGAHANVAENTGKKGTNDRHARRTATGVQNKQDEQASG